MDKYACVIVRLSLIEGVGAVTINRICARGLQPFDQSELYVRDLQNEYQLSLLIATSIAKSWSCMQAYDREMERAQRHSVHIVTRMCADYPERLRELPVPPPVLYVRGAIGSLQEKHTVAMVGSRDADQYARRIAQLLVPPLAHNGCCIVSGGARGVDALAHAAAVTAGGPTVVVLGSGLLRPYPRENIRLFDAVVAGGGAVVSAFSLDTQARPGHFPVRNRIIAGLSKICVVIQAAQKSGALITANYALELGRDVFAVPGPIDNPRFDGCHTLLKNGAGLVQSATDIMEALGSYLTMPLASNDTNDPLLAALSQGPQHATQLCKLTDDSCDTLEERLFDLQLSGKVQQCPSGQWLLAE